MAEAKWDVNEAAARVWTEYDAAAEYLAVRGFTGKIGDPLPPNLSAAVLEEINADPEAFQARVNDCAYAHAMGSH